jgi:hypothetical protein
MRRTLVRNLAPPPRARLLLPERVGRQASRTVCPFDSRPSSLAEELELSQQVPDRCTQDRPILRPPAQHLQPWRHHRDGRDRMARTQPTGRRRRGGNAGAASLSSGAPMRRGSRILFQPTSSVAAVRDTAQDRYYRRFAADGPRCWLTATLPPVTGQRTQAPRNRCEPVRARPAPSCPILHASGSLS